MLEPFRPYLTGHVLDGTAGRYAEIELEAFPDSGKEVEIFLLNLGVRFEQNEPRRGGAEVPECVLTFEHSEFPVRLSLVRTGCRARPYAAQWTGFRACPPAYCGSFAGCSRRMSSLVRHALLVIAVSTLAAAAGYFFGRPQSCLPATPRIRPSGRCPRTSAGADPA